MPDTLLRLLHDISWPAALALAWLAGEAGQRWLRLPRVSGYGIAGFLMAASQGGFLADPEGAPVTLLADFAFALILFELGYRINLRWLRANPWLGATSILEAFGTFGAVLAVALAFDVPPVPALLLAALTMSTSPAAVLRVANDLRSAGQVTERIMHLSAFNCVLSVATFKAVLGYSILTNSGSVFHAIWSSLVVVLASAGIGTLFGVAVPGLLRGIGGLARNATIAFALAALLLTTLTHALKFSPLLAALAFGLVARHRRVILSQAQRNFGALGDLLTVLLFVFVAATIDGRQALAGATLGLSIVGVRLAVKTAVTTLLSRASGISWRKGALTGVAMMPLSVFAILLMEQTRRSDFGAFEEMAGIAAVVLLLEVAGPLFTQWALARAGESVGKEER
ncbi:sodium:proton antiporter [Denitratisoma sp. DHT3]|uniref:cation:proton antiporter n=1 Tax=Denitratisoma sp. DHT3 TaxID=1981880 RepID=UPI0011986751|nr:cation:proton antiporter [Denitratisoma sp. DHT3]QDX82710.1 sodium:proton antiporter [Denitratisoma sp. DHT3]